MNVNLLSLSLFKIADICSDTCISRCSRACIVHYNYRTKRKTAHHKKIKYITASVTLKNIVVNSLHVLKQPAHQTSLVLHYTQMPYVHTYVHTCIWGLRDDELFPLPAAGGTVYTRWGKRSCPSGIGTLLLYRGRVAGSPYYTLGGGSNYLCMPDYPQYAGYTSGVQGWSIVGGGELESRDGPLRNVHNYDLYCAVCYVPRRQTSVMIPARYSCPRGWTREYWGYLMSSVSKSGFVDKRTMFECVDSRPDVIPGTGGETPHVSVFYHTEANCNGLQCPPYNPQKELTCVVCTRWSSWVHTYLEHESTEINYCTALGNRLCTAIRKYTSVCTWCMCICVWSLLMLKVIANCCIKLIKMFFFHSQCASTRRL